MFLAQMGFETSTIINTSSMLYFVIVVKEPLLKTKEVIQCA